jgi:aspartyl-tRNA(Asn)/glutamyl-tRNA(Gln) amidotransferase subunit A
LEAEALRVQAAHAMAAAPFDAFLCPCVPGAAPLAEAVVADPVASLWREWAPWTFLFNLTRQPAISVPVGTNEAGLPLAVQVAAPLYGDDVALRVARTVEKGRD